MNLPNTIPPLTEQFTIPEGAVSPQECIKLAQAGEVTKDVLQAAIFAADDLVERVVLQRMGLTFRTASHKALDQARVDSQMFVARAWREWDPKHGNGYAFMEAAFPTKRRE